MNMPRRNNRRPSLWTRIREATLGAGRGRATRSRAGRLASAAGCGFGESFESLEQRQLLFSLTIQPGDVNPATGLGTRSVTFGYVIPYLFKQLPTQNGMPDTVIEEFEDEMDPWTTVFPPVPPNGTIFNQSEIQIAYRTQAANAIQLLFPTGPTAVPGVADGGQNGANDRDLGISLVGTDQVSFSFMQGTGQGMQGTSRLTTNARFTIRPGPGRAGVFDSDGDGLKTDADGTRLELIRDGVVVQTFSGAALAALGQDLGNGTAFTVNFAAGFDTLRLSAANQLNTAAYADAFILDDIATTFPPDTWADFVSSRIFGATAVLTGPAGTTARFLDLYGADMIARTDLGAPNGGAGLPNVDRNGDGIPDFNDGIGSISITGGNARSALTMVGGDFMTPGFFPTDSKGLFDEFEQAGFGYDLTNENPPRVMGLPEGAGSVIIGSPYVRNRSSTGAYTQQPGSPPANDQFLNPDQGIFVNGTSFGAIKIHGVVHGSSRVDGSLAEYNAGYQLGNLSVRGDLGSYIVASDAGQWESDNGQNSRKVGAQLTVGRTVREIAIGGRNALNTQVLADINNPTRPAISFLDFVEHEVSYGFDPATPNGVQQTFNATINNNENWNNRTTSLGQASFFGLGNLRNDSLTTAEFVGYNGTAVNVRGFLGAEDPVNSAEDIADVYAFAADPTREVVIQIGSLGAGSFFDYVRILDRNGLPIAATDRGAAGRGQNGNAGLSNLLRFRPDHADVYYLVVNSAPQGSPGIEAAYNVLITGMAPVTVGSVRSGAGAGQAVFTLNSGSVGSLRPGMGFLDGMAMEKSPNDVVNSTQNDDDLMQWGASSYSIPGDLFNVSTGGDINGTSLLVGHNLGTVVTAISPVAGQGQGEGDLTSVDIRVGGTLGILNISGALGADQDPDPDSRNRPVSIRTGTSGGKGDIGQILIGAYASTGAFTLTTSPGSTIDQFIVRGDRTPFTTPGFTNTPGQLLDGTPIFRLGAGSDLRFADFGLIQNDFNNNVNLQLAYNQTLTLTDDGGARFTVRISGGDATAIQSRAEIRVLPIDGAQGVAVARIDVVLVGGANFDVQAVETGSGDAGATISIGRIVVTVGNNAGGPNPQATNSVTFSDAGGVQAEIDIGQLEVFGSIGSVVNNTVGRNQRAGDIVAIDAGGLQSITITGNLGRTQTNGAGSTLLGPFLGVANTGGDVRSPFPVNAQAIDQQGVGVEGTKWDTGQIFNPIQLTDYTAPSPLEDIGSPVDPYLNGVIIRAGDLNDVRAGGSIGDVVLGNGHLINVVANSDGIRPFGAFEGIVGSLYANVIGTVDVGDGLLGTGPGPFAQAGIFANDEIIAVNATRVPNAQIRGTIIAADVDNLPRTTIGTATPTNLPAPVQGFGALTVANGVVDGALIYSMELDDWWKSSRVTDRDDFIRTGRIERVTLTNTTLFRSELEAGVVNTITITGGAFDASSVRANENVILITADEYRNSTLLGQTSEFHLNEVRSTRNVGSIVTNGLTGDMSDLFVDVLGIVSGRIAARNLIRNDINVANRVNEISAVADAKSVSVTSGHVVNFNVGGNIRQSSFNIAGPIDNLLAGGEMTGLVISSNGPDGRIGTIRASGRIVGQILTSGPVQTIESVNSDITGNIVGDDVDVSIGTLRAGRDLLVDMRILSNANAIIAGRNIGRSTDGNDHALDIRGNLGSVTAGGQIFSDILVGQNITGTISSGRAVGKPGNDQVGTADIVAFGSINALNFMGDFNGNITSYSGGITSITITDGSFRQGRLIKALGGSIGTVSIAGGDLLGDIYTEGSIARIEVLSRNGFNGQIGVSNTKSNSTSVDAFRNQLPPDTNKTAGFDGPHITALQDITSIFVQNGSIWETTIRAGRTISNITINGGGFRNDSLTSGQASCIVAGDRIESITANAFSNNAMFLAGVVGFGDDNHGGGIGSAADTVKQGSIGSIVLKGKNNNNIKISAGLNAGGDGIYNTGDDTRATGVSSIGSVAVNDAHNSSVFADAGIGSATGGAGLTVKRNGANLVAADPTLFSGKTGGAVGLAAGVPFNITTTSGQKAQVTFTGPGKVFWDASLNRIILSNTTTSTTLLVQGRKNGANNNNANLKDLVILGNNNAQLGSLRVNARLQGASKVFADGNVASFFINRVNTTDRIGAGGDITTFGANVWDAGDALGRAVGAFTIGGAFGSSSVSGEATATFLDLGTLNIASNLSGSISSDQDITSVTAGSINGGAVRSGGEMGQVTAASIVNSTISARDVITGVGVTGEVRDSSILAGVDLGQDAAFGGSGLNADAVSNGDIGPINVGGSFPMSDVSAGVYRGPDGFLGTADDIAADGRSTIGQVTIAGQVVGSNINSEQYRVISTGSIGQVTVAGSVLAFRGNFRVVQLGAQPVPVTVTDLTITQDSRVYRATFSFNQPIDAGTFSQALSIAEVRNSGATLIGLAEGISADYTVKYDQATNTGTVTFSRNVTDRNLPQQAGVPGPGVFRFILSGAIFRGASQNVLLDGNGDGTTGDDYSADAVVGDAGDKLTAGNPNGAPGIDFYAPVDLDVLLDSNYHSDNAPDININYTIQGTIGDHPDTNADTFRTGSDVDLYRVSLRAGQILRLGRVGGVAIGAVRSIFNDSGQVLSVNSPGQVVQPQGVQLLTLPANTNNDASATGEEQYLVTQTGTYIIAVSSADPTTLDIADVNSIPNENVAAGRVGAYSFTVQIFDDGNTGFNGDTDSGNGSPVVNAPLPIVFAGADGSFGTTDDVSTFTTGTYNFTLNRGPDGRPNTADDVVSGSDGGEIVSTRTVGADGVWGTTDDVVTSSVSAAIGLPGSSGVPQIITPDADVYRLNGGNPIAPGTRVRVTLKLTDVGGNLGLPANDPAVDGQAAVLALRNRLQGDVQLALFETPSGTGFSDAKLVASPNDFVGIGGQKPTTTSDGVNSYGYDANGDFFMEIVLPGALGINNTNVPASYAIYVQGVVRTDYTLDILTQGTGTIQRSSQNILLETLGGAVDWLETSGVQTKLDAFSTSVLGFVGQINGIDVDTYVLTQLVANLNDLFAAANVDIRISTDASSFEGSQFSTVFLAGNTEPNAFFNDGEFGVSEHVDMLNIDKTDQAVVFMPSLAVLGNDPSQAGVDNLVRALTAAVGRRIGELIGLRIADTDPNTSPVAIMSSNSVTNNPGPGGVYRFTDTNSLISSPFDTNRRDNFFMGTQNSLQLIQRILAPKA